jgi:hypothetical protein
LQSNHFHWEEVCWWLLANNFGMRVNSEAFEKNSTVFTTIYINKTQTFHSSTRSTSLLGQAGLLEAHFINDYPNLLKREYKFLKNKYGLQAIHLPIYFLRMRPANFPTVRLAQLAMLIHKSLHLFSKIIAANDVKEIYKLLQVTANDFWHYHYHLEEETAFQPQKLGNDMIDIICINTVIPLLFTYGMYQNNQAFKDKALAWLQAIKSERNNIIKRFLKMGIPMQSAFDSQALLQMKNQYCNKKRRLECSVGNYLLKNQFSSIDILPLPQYLDVGFFITGQ